MRLVMFCSASSGEQRGEQGMDIHGVVEGATHPNVLERTASGVDRDVEIAKGRAPLQLLSVSVLPSLGLADRHLDHAQLAGLERSELVAHLESSSAPALMVVSPW